MRSRTLVGAGVLALGLAPRAWAGTATDAAPPVVVVTGRAPAPEILTAAPQTAVEASGEALAERTDLVSSDDVMKTFPAAVVRQRHFGDTQAPLATRTSGVGASARSLVYEDGVLVSALIGNNNTNASPRWDLLDPDEIAAVRVLYGPFSAAYPGNALGETVEIATRPPEAHAARLTLQGAWQSFGLYGRRDDYGSGRIAASVSDRWGPLAVRLSGHVLRTEAQPLTVLEAGLAAAPAPGAPLVSGALPATTRTGAPVAVVGVGALERQTVAGLDLDARLDLPAGWRAAYRAAWYRNEDRAGVETDLRDGTGAPVFAGSFRLAPGPAAVPASLFTNNLYRLDEDHLAQAVRLDAPAAGPLSVRMIATSYLYLEDRQRNPSLAPPAGLAGGPGLATSLKGSGWATLDVVADWRGAGSTEPTASLGAHADGYRLESPRYALADWRSGGAGGETGLAKGETRTLALWGQGVLGSLSAASLTLGLRLEDWRADHGLNASVAPALFVRQPPLAADAVSPKAVAALVRGPWRISASAGRAVRFPTVEELYQTVQAGPLLVSPNPRLKPEDGVSEELSLERRLGPSGRGGSLRLSLFEEHVANALLSQTAPVAPGSTTLASYVQNVGRTRARGVELAADVRGLPGGLELSGWLDAVASRIQEDAAFAAAVGRRIPQLPTLRAGALQSLEPRPGLRLTLSERYSDRAFGTIDNSDRVANVFTGFGAYFLVDLHARLALGERTSLDLGADNLLDRTYFLYHPFPGRTVVATLRTRF